MKLTKKQTLALDILEDDHTKELAFGGGAGGGKSALGCYWITKSCLKTDINHRVCLRLFCKFAAQIIRNY